MRWTLLAPYLAATALHLVCDVAGWNALADATQVLLMPALALFLAGSAREPAPLLRLTRWAILFSWLGDSVPLLLTGDAAFGVKLACFLLAQVCYIRAFAPYAATSLLRTRRAWLAPYAVAVVVLLALCVPAAGALAPAVVVYGCCLATMAVLATGLNPLTWAGAAVFMTSDSLIALDAFGVWTQPGHDFWVMATYCAAQLLLVLGVLRQAAAEAGEAPGHHPSVVPAG
jgi:uncharacterized membrane protein YhhN